MPPVKVRSNMKDADKHLNQLDLFQEEDMELRTVLGRPLDEAASTLQKAIRRGEEEIAVYIAREMAESGYVDYLFRRLYIIANEDIGPAEPDATVRVMAGREANSFACSSNKTGRKYDSDIIANTVLVMCRSKKSREASDLDALIALKFKEIIETKDFTKVLATPDWALDKHTAKGRAKKRGGEFFQRVGRVINPDYTTPKGEVWKKEVMKKYGGVDDENK